MPTQNILLPGLIPDSFGNDNTPYNMGIIFYSTVPGSLLGIRHYKALGDDGLHIGRLYNLDTQQLLISVNFTNESVQGWQEAFFESPYSIAAMQRYVAAVNLANNIYPFKGPVFQTDYINGVLVAPGGGNNRFATSSNLFPDAFFNSACYFRDVIFSTGGETKLQSIIRTNTQVRAKISAPCRLTSSLQAPVQINGYLRIRTFLRSAVNTTSLLTLKLRSNTRLVSRLNQSTLVKGAIRQVVDLQSPDLIQSRIKGNLKTFGYLRSREQLPINIAGIIKNGLTSIERLKPIRVSTNLELKFRSVARIKSQIQVNIAISSTIRVGFGANPSQPAHITVKMVPNATISITSICN